jgi:hypothetical protein
MRPIQILLVIFFAAISLLYFRRLRRRLIDRILFLAITISAVLMVARPDWANSIAQYVGVGRGADLLTYLGLSGLGFLWLQLYTRQRAQKEQITDLVRRMAILEAKKTNK